MPRDIIVDIDSFMHSRSPSDIPEDKNTRISLYEALGQQVSDDWADYMKFYQTIFNSLNDEYKRGLLNSKASMLQEMCTMVVSELEDIHIQRYSRESLFKVKELVIRFRIDISNFREEIKSQFSYPGI